MPLFLQGWCMCKACCSVYNTSSTCAHHETRVYGCEELFSLTAWYDCVHGLLCKANMSIFLAKSVTKQTS